MPTHPDIHERHPLTCVFNPPPPFLVHKTLNLLLQPSTSQQSLRCIRPDEACSNSCTYNCFNMTEKKSVNSCRECDGRSAADCRPNNEEMAAGVKLIIDTVKRRCRRLQSFGQHGQRLGRFRYWAISLQRSVPQSHQRFTLRNTCSFGHRTKRTGIKAVVQVQ